MKVKDLSKKKWDPEAYNDNITEEFIKIMNQSLWDSRTIPVNTSLCF